MWIRDADGGEVLELGDDEFVGGYAVKDFDDSSRKHKRITTDAPRVDSEYDESASLRRMNLRLVVEVQGSTQAELRARRGALLAAVEVPVWILDVDGTIQYQCAVSDSESPRYANPAALSREVTLTIPAHPSAYGY